jgi:hypothetical protein
MRVPKRDGTLETTTPAKTDTVQPHGRFNTRVCVRSSSCSRAAFHLMRIEPRDRWLAVVVSIGPLIPVAVVTGHLTLASIAAGIVVWALGELCDEHRLELESPAIEYQRVISTFRIAFNLAGLFLFSLAAYRFMRFGFWPFL